MTGRLAINLRLLAAAALFLLCVNGFHCYYTMKVLWLQSQDTGHFLISMMIWTVSTLLALVILFKALSFHRVLLYGISAVLYLSNALANAASFQMHAPITFSMVQAALFSPFSDIVSFITWPQLVLVACGAGVFWVHIRLVRPVLTQRDDPKAYLLCGLLCGFVLVSDSSTVLSDQPPYHVVKPLLAAVSPFRSGPIQDETIFSTDDPRPRVVVLVIGESARADHFSVNGYKRRTDPNIRALENIVSYADAFSCAALTHTALTCMLTDATLADFKDTHAVIPKWGFSMVEGFKRAGFSTAWIGMQGYRGFTPIPYLQIADQAESTTFPGAYVSLGKPPYDEAVLPYIHRIIQEHPQERKFLVVHLYGSHFPYSIRYPERFNQFTPACASSSELRDLTSNDLRDCDTRQPGSVANAYDNSLLYTDHVLKQIIDQLGTSNALMLYVSDHGQSLGEQGTYMHGLSRRIEQRHVPMIFWASRGFIADYPQQWQHLLANRHMAVSHDHVFHTLLDCAGVRSKRVDTKWSLCGDQPMPRSEQMP